MDVAVAIEISPLHMTILLYYTVVKSAFLRASPKSGTPWRIIGQSHYIWTDLQVT